MNSEELISLIAQSKKSSPIKAYVQCKQDLEFTDCLCFGEKMKILIGEYDQIMPQLQNHRAEIDRVYIEQNARNSALKLSDLNRFRARIEPGAIIREFVKIGDNAVIMMGAIINAGAVIGEKTMIDMNAVVGGRAMIGKNCHIGAGAVISGVIEPASAVPVVIEDHVLIGANAVVLEGVRIRKNAVVAAGAVVLDDVDENALVAGVPARFIKIRDDRTDSRTIFSESLRKLEK